MERFKFKLWGLSRIISDHCPLILMEDVRDWGPKPFKFQNAWCLHPKFGPFVENVWRETQFSGVAGAVMHKKLQSLKLALKQWNREVCGNVASKIKDGNDELHNLDLEAEDRPLEEAKLKQKRELRSEVWKLSRMMEWEWLQKSRLDWNLKGDRNTQFFHVTANCRHNRNALNSISVRGVVVEEPNQVKQEVWDYFRNHFTKDWVIRPVLVGDFKSVSHSQCFDRLEAEFSEEKIWAVVKGCNGNEAPGPDGFNSLCFQKHWKVFKKEVIMFMKEFHSKGRLVNGLNCSFITLIPKKENASSLSEYIGLLV